MMKKIIAIVLVLVLAAAAYSYLSRKKAPPPKPEGISVLAGKVVQKAMPVVIEAIGTVEPSKTVTVYSRVVGQLLKIHFKEGQDVARGDLIFTLDPQSYKEKVRMAEAKVALDRAQLKFNDDEAKRYAYLMEKGAVSKSDYENKETIASTQRNLVQSDEADLENARLQVQYCYIRSPLSGRTGSFMANEGTMIKDNDTKLAVINQMTPIYVKFSIPEKQLPEIRKYMGLGTLKVRVYPAGPRDKTFEGTLFFIDNSVDISTGMIVLKASFPNHDKALWPGQFVSIALSLTIQNDALVAPSRAAQVDQRGNFVFVVKPDGIVEQRPVTVARTIGEEAVISKGLAAGEVVVTDGQLKLRNGVPVEIRETLSSGSPAQNQKPAGPAETKKTTPSGSN